MKNIVLLLSLISVGLLTGCATGKSYSHPGYSAEKIGKVAVVVHSEVLDDVQKREIGDLFSMEILNRGYIVIDRGNLDQLMTEVSFQNESGVTSEADKSKLAVKNIKTMMVVNVSEFGENMSMTAKMVNVNTGTLLWMGSGTGSKKSGLSTIGGAALGAVGGAAVANQVDNSGTSKAIGAVGGAALGGLAGKALEPEQANLVRKVIVKVTKNIPPVVQGQSN